MGSLKVTEIKDDDAVMWDRYVLSHPRATGYHLIGWKRVMEEAFGHRTFYLAAKDEQGEIRGVLPLVFLASRLFGRFLVSMPFFNYGGILVDTVEIQDAVLEKAVDLARKLNAAHIELRHQSGTDLKWPCKQHKVSMRLDLPGSFDIVWNGFSSKLRSQIRRSQKEEMTVQIGSEEILYDFYQVFSRNMRDLGTPGYGLSFFATILKTFPKETRICVVYMESRPLAVGFLYGFRQMLEIPWASSDRQYNHFAPNMLLYGSVLEYACQQGFRAFDFGRSSPNSGTYRFKEQWGARPLPLFLALLGKKRWNTPGAAPPEPEIPDRYQCLAANAGGSDKDHRSGHREKYPVKIQRTIPPTAAPITMRDLMHGLNGMVFGRRYLRRLEEEVKSYFNVRHVFLVSSGKAALYLILQALKSLSCRKQVLIPAYTCYSVPSAVLKANLNLSLVDIDPATLDFDYGLLEKSIDKRTLCVVPTHLFGLPSDMDRVNALCRSRGAFVVEDAAQAMGGEYNGKKLGTLGDVAFFSLGRGKNVTCGSGGIILTNSDVIAQAIHSEYAKLKNTPLWKMLMNLLEVFGVYLLMRPSVYGFPEALPFLGLGETRFFSDFPVRRLDGVRAGLMSRWKERLDRSNRARRVAAGDLIGRLGTGNGFIRSSGREKMIYLRLPIMLESRTAKEELCALSKKKGLGISPMYPTAIQDIKELKGRLENTEYPGAKSVAGRLVTLPVNPFVNQKDREAISIAIENLKSSISEGNFSNVDPSVRKANA